MSRDTQAIGTLEAQIQSPTNRHGARLFVFALGLLTLYSLIAACSVAAPHPQKVYDATRLEKNKHSKVASIIYRDRRILFRTGFQVASLSLRMNEAYPNLAFFDVELRSEKGLNVKSANVNGRPLDMRLLGRIQMPFIMKYGIMEKIMIRVPIEVLVEWSCRETETPIPFEFIGAEPFSVNVEVGTIQGFLLKSEVYRVERLEGACYNLITEMRNSN